MCIATLLAWSISYVWSYRNGYRAFVQTFEDRRTALAELFADESPSGQALAVLYPLSASRVQEYAHLLKSDGAGPFSPRMSHHRPQLDPFVTPSRVAEGEGRLETAACIVINGWAWDSTSAEYGHQD